ncbi:MAG: putative Zn-dependent protease [Gammaproteobacteria bacterium]|jgi:predicted Zn-dependent protease
MRKRQLVYGCAIAFVTSLFVSSAAAFDFGKLADAVKKLDVNKALEVGQRLVASTTELSLDQEIALGDDLTARLLGAMPPLNDPTVQSYVNRVGRWLSVQTERPDLPWRFAIVDTDSLGAFATPGGNVVISAGLVRLMRSEDELAGVLAHEIAHVVKKHHVKAIMGQARAVLARDAAASMASEYVADNPLVSGAVMSAGLKLYSSGLDQSDELSADQAGMIIATRAGYDPLGLVLVLTTLDSIDASEPRGSLMFSTHPPTRERIDRLAEFADQTSRAYPGMLRDVGRFSVVQEKLFAAP